MTITDWSASSADQLAVLYAEEAARWRTAFDWNSAAQWREVEEARTRWDLPGLVARDPAGRLSGWLFYLPTPAGPQLGGVSANDAATTRALVDTFAEREAGRPVTGFMPDLAPGLADALTSAGLAVTPHLYLAAPLANATDRVDVPGLDGSGPPVAGGRRPFCALPGRMETTPGSFSFESRAKRTFTHPRPERTDVTRIRTWCAGDELHAAEVLRDAYEPDEAVLFAPNGTPGEWEAYVMSLVRQVGCGSFVPEASMILEADGVAVGVAMVTRLSPGMAHMAQIAVRRNAQGSGDGARLLSAAMSSARNEGADAMSLLVSSLNDRALRFYERHGFLERGRFLEVPSSRLAALVLRAS